MEIVAGDDGDSVEERGGGDLLVEGVVGIGGAKAAPDVGSLLVEGKNGVGVIGDDAP